MERDRVSSANNVGSAEDLFESCTKTIRADVVRKAISARLNTTAAALSGSIAYDFIRAQSIENKYLNIEKSIHEYHVGSNIVSKVIKKENELKTGLQHY